MKQLEVYGDHVMRQLCIKIDNETLERLDKIVYVLRSMGFKDMTRSDLVRQGINHVIRYYYTVLDIDSLYAIYRQAYKKIIRGEIENA